MQPVKAGERLAQAGKEVGLRCCKLGPPDAPLQSVMA